MRQGQFNVAKVVLGVLLVSALCACDVIRVKVVSLSPPSAVSGQSEKVQAHSEAFKIVEEVALRNGLRSRQCSAQAGYSICKAFDGAVYVEAYVVPGGEFRVRFVDSSVISSTSRIEEEITSALRQKLDYSSVTVRQ